MGGGRGECITLVAKSKHFLFWFIFIILSREGVQYQPYDPQVLNL